MKLRPERDIQRAIMGALKAHGIFALRMNAGLTLLEHKGKKRAIRMMPDGTADILALVKRHFFDLAKNTEHCFWYPVWLECKRHGAEQRPAQRQFEILVKAEGHHYAVVHDVTEAMEACKL